MKYNFLYKFTAIAAKKYAKGCAVVFTGLNIMDLAQNGHKDFIHNMASKLVLTAAWPVTLPLMAGMCGSSGALGLWLALLILL